MTNDVAGDGLFLLSWAETQIDGEGGVPLDQVQPGASWLRWGDAVDLAPASRLAPPGRYATSQAYRNAATSEARRIVDAALGERAHRIANTRSRTLTLTEGQNSWLATVIDAARPSAPLLLFLGDPPPKDRAVQVAWIDRPHTGNSPIGMPAHGFTPGTWIETPGGSRQVRHLSAGDKVLTLDAGVQEIIWTGRRVQIANAADPAPILVRSGALNAVCHEGDLLIGPDHRLLLAGRKDGTEALVTARDLVNGDTILPCVTTPSPGFFQVLLESHHIMVANGFAVESFLPTHALLDTIARPDRLRLFDVMPGLATNPASYGPSARPTLSAAEAALVQAA